MKINEKERFNALMRRMQRPDGTLRHVSHILYYAQQQYAMRTALVGTGSTMTYNELYQHVMRLATQLRERGVVPHDKIVLCIDNSPAFFVAYYAVWHIGAVVVPLNTFLKAFEIAHILKDAAPKMALVSSVYQTVFEAVDSTLPLIGVDSLITPLQSSQIVDAVLPLFDDVSYGPDSMVALLYTSGTTGNAKGVMLSTTNIITNICQSVVRFTLNAQERVLGVLPFFHSFSQVASIWCTIFVGALVIIVPKIERHAVAAALKYKPTLFLGVPALYGLLCLLKNAPLHSVRYFISGGDALPNKIRLLFGLIYQRKICNGYGLTEASPVIAIDLDEGIAPINCVGRPVFGVRVQIKDDTGHAVGTAMIGSLWVQGNNIMRGYYNNLVATNEVCHDGWLDTGDLAYQRHDGSLVITGREKDLIINKGVNIYPQEIENVILSHPNVLRVAVIGRSDDDGQIPVAYVQLKKEMQDIERELKKLCIQHLAMYKVPRAFIASVTPLPLTATGKVEKKVLYAQDNAQKPQ